MNRSSRRHSRRMPGQILALMIVLALAGCSSEPPAGPAAPASPSATDTQETPSPAAEPFPVRAFADVNADPVSEARAAELQAVLEEMSDDADGAGMSATVLSPAGSWSGAAGTADASGRKVGVGDQFAVASIRKTFVAAQVMQLVEAGELGLDDQAAQYLPPGLKVHANGATIRELMGMYSGIPQWGEDFETMLVRDPHRVWTTAEALALLPARRTPAGIAFEYSDANYLLLTLMIEHVAGRTMAEVMRDGGVLDTDGVERLVYQPDERPSAPIALPEGTSHREWLKGRGYLPSIASVSAGTIGPIATSSRSLARWWQALCSGELVSPGSLSTMARDVGTGYPVDEFADGYGLGLTNMTGAYTRSFGHGGLDLGYVAWAACLPETGSVVAVLSNTTEVPDEEEIQNDRKAWPRPLVTEVESP
jgi:D-alanyl-D-alanine carboxypeptidase